MKRIDSRVPTSMKRFVSSLQRFGYPLTTTGFMAGRIDKVVRMAKHSRIWDENLTRELAADRSRPRLPMSQGGRVLTTQQQMRRAYHGLRLVDLVLMDSYACQLCGQRVDDGKPCGCGAR